MNRCALLWMMILMTAGGVLAQAPSESSFLSEMALPALTQALHDRDPFGPAGGRVCDWRVRAGGQASDTGIG